MKTIKIKNKYFLLRNTTSISFSSSKVTIWDISGKYSEISLSDDEVKYAEKSLNDFLNYQGSDNWILCDLLEGFKLE